MCVPSFSKKQRILSFLLSICMLFFVLSVPVNAVAAEAVIVTVGAAALVASTLVACGLYVSGDKQAFTDLCNGIVDTLKFAQSLPLKAVLGVTYVANELVDKIVSAANEKKAFVPSANMKTSFTTAQYGTLPVFEPNSVLSFSDYSSTSFPKPPLFETVGLTWNGFKFCYGYNYNYLVVYCAPISTNNSFLTGTSVVSSAYSLPIGSVTCFAEMASFFPAFLTNNFVGYEKKYIGSGVYGYCPFVLASLSNCEVVRLFLSSDHYYNSGNDICFTESVDDGILGQAGFNVNEHAPSISAEGKVEALPKAWATSDVIDGVQSVPVTVPQTVEEALDLTQDKAQEGATDKTEAKPDVKPDEANKDFERNKLKFQLPVIIKERFPFCIPFDIYNGIVLLSAPAVAPVLTVPLKFDYQDIHFGQDFVFDFNNEDFKLPFTVLRWGEMLCFVIALAAATKKIVWG